MSTYYVSPSGTNDGSHGTSAGAGAWLTLTYALGTSGIPLTGGPHTLVVADGTYSEGTTTGLIINRAYGSLLTIQGNETTPANVIVQAGNANVLTALTLLAAQNIIFRGFTFRANGTGAGGGTLLCRHNDVTANIGFKSCSFLLPAVPSAIAYSTLAKAFAGLSFEDCTFDCDAAATQTSISSSGGVGIAQAGLSIKNCTFFATSPAVNIYDVADLTIQDCAVFASGSAGVLIGRDGVQPNNSTTATVRRVRVFASGAGTHAFLIGTGSVNSRISECEVFGPANGGYGFVLKGIGDVIDRSLVMAGGMNGIYFKGSKNVSVLNSTVIQQAAGDECVSCTVGLVRTENPDGKASGSTMRNCMCVAAPGSVVFDWDQAAHDSTDSIRLAGYSGTIGTNLPANGYGSPHVGVGPACPGRHGWHVG